MKVDILNPPVLVRRGSSIWKLTKLGAGEGGISSFLPKWRATVTTHTYQAMVAAMESGDRQTAIGYFRGLAALSDGGIPFSEEDSTEQLSPL